MPLSPEQIREQAEHNREVFRAGADYRRMAKTIQRRSDDGWADHETHKSVNAAKRWVRTQPLGTVYAA